MYELLDRFYAEYLGCPVEALRHPGVVVGVQSEEAHYNGLFVWRREQSCVLSVPPEHLEPVRRYVRDKSIAEVWGEAQFRALFGAQIERIVGPTWVGNIDWEELRSVDLRDARVLSRGDARALWDLEVACAPLEWRHAGIGLDLPVVVGCEVKGRLVAVAGYTLWGKEVAHVGVVTHPEYRGQGYGKAAVAALTLYAGGRGLIMQYRALESNPASIGIAVSLGYRPYASTYSVRLIPCAQL
jgi:GNAT superfamily N-acetyltransferase